MCADMWLGHGAEAPYRKPLRSTPANEVNELPAADWACLMAMAGVSLNLRAYEEHLVCDIRAVVDIAAEQLVDLVLAEVPAVPNKKKGVPAARSLASF